MSAVHGGRAIRALFAGAALWLAAPAQSAVLDFDATTAAQYLFANHAEDGFELSLQSGHYDFFGPGVWCNLTSGVCTSNFLNVDSSAYGPATIRLSRQGGGVFDLVSFDVLDVYDFNQQGSVFSACGLGCVVRSSSGGLLELVQGTMSFSDAAWQGVSWIEFSAASLGSSPRIGSAAIDNITLAVPEPASALLMGAALWACGRRGRRNGRGA
jgi:hypothetical protein